LVADSPGLDPAWPAGDQRHSDSAFVEIPLDASKPAAAVEELRSMPAFGVRAVVAAEDYESPAVEVQFLEQVEQLADAAVHARDHGGKVLFRLRPGFFGVGSVVRDLHAVGFLFVVRVGNGEGQ